MKSYNDTVKGGLHKENDIKINHNTVVKKDIIHIK